MKIIQRALVNSLGVSYSSHLTSAGYIYHNSESILAYYFSQSCILYSDSPWFSAFKIPPGTPIAFSCQGSLWVSSRLCQFLRLSLFADLDIWGWLGGVFHKMSTRIWEMFSCDYTRVMGFGRDDYRGKISFRSHCTEGTCCPTFQLTWTFIFWLR